MPAFPTGDAANVISEIYSKKLQAKFYKSTVLGAICNTHWEGEIRDQGNKVIIRSRPTITISDYDGTVSYEGIESDKIELLIDKAKYYAFKEDDIQTAQADIAIINESTQDAAENMKITVDSDVLGAIYSDVPAANQIAAPATGVQVTKDNILDYIVDMGTLLDEANVPETGRWLVLAPWMCGLIKKSDLRDASLAGDGTSILRNGRMGMIDRFTLYNSNNIAAVAGANTVYMCMAGTRDFCSFASQFVKDETVRLTDTFGTGHRGLKVYGYKVTKPEAGALLPAYK